MVLNNIYYLFKPFLPRRVQLALRRMRIRKRALQAKDIWPINRAAGDLPPDWQGWPDGKQFAVVITHDVESTLGIQKCKKLAETDTHYGFRSAFNIVPQKYPVPAEVRSWLKEHGFEVGVHDYNHDGKLYKSKDLFEKRAKVINRFLIEWNASGFRSASMHHNLDWIAQLEVEYDCSTFDTDPFEPQPDGVNTIFPYLYQNKILEREFIEIPYTLPQDFTLFVLMKEKNCRIWKDKIRWIAEKGGMVTVIVHPDYINFDKNRKNGVNEYSCSIYQEFLGHIKNEYNGQYWQPLPGELALYVKNMKTTNTTAEAT